MRNSPARRFVGRHYRAGTVLIVTMWVALVLAALVLVFSDSMRIAAAVSANNVAAIEAECIASAAVEYVKANLMTSKEDAEATSLETKTTYDAVKVGKGYFWVLRSNLENDQDYEFGLTDEAGKINLNTANYDMLMKLPGMTDELAASIIDWRDADSDVTTNGAEDDYYLLLPDPYNCKNAPLETVEEILLIKGGTEDLLYGEDTNLNGHLDDNENDGDASEPPNNQNGVLDRGFYDYVTVYSAESNLDSSGNARININDSAARPDLLTLLTNTFSADRATTIMASMGSSSASLVAFFLNAKAGASMTVAEFDQIADRLTTSSDANVPGLVNVNTASKPVLMCLPGLEEADVDALIAYRQSKDNLVSVAWVTEVLDQTKAMGIGPYITVHSYQCSADIVAISGNGRAYRRYKAVIDVSGTKPRVTYWKSLTRFGWPLPESIVTALRKGQPLTNDEWVIDWARIMLGTRTILGLAIDEFGIVAAEVSARSGRGEIRHVGQMTFDDKLSSDNMGDRAGQLKQFLRANRFSSRQVIIGIPLKWVVAREMVAPPASADAVAGMLGIQAERAFSFNASELIFDYYGSTSTTENSRVMLLAARRQMIEQIKEMAVSAGLHPQAVTVSVLAFNDRRSPAGSQQRFGLYARPTYCEFWSQSNGRLQTIRHVPIASSNGSAGDHVDLLTSTIQKQVMFSPQQDQSPPYEVTLYDASGLSSAVIDRLNKQLKPQITLADGRGAFLAGASAAADHSAQAQSVAAAAVAMTVISAARPVVDFLNPRIGAKQVSSHKKVITWGAAVAAACVLGVGLVALDWRLKQSDIATYKAQLDELQPQIDAAQKVVDRVSYAGPWISQNPRFLECLKELTQVFPQRPNSVWATSLNLNDKGGGSMVGKAVDVPTALAVIDAIANNPAFTQVNRNYIREAGKEGFDFSVNFQFKGGK